MDSAAQDTDSGHSEYQVGKTYLCTHGPLLYEAKVLNSRFKNDRWEYRVHYKGWKTSWDEWVVAARMLHINEENLATQALWLQAHKAKRQAATDRIAASSSSAAAAMGKKRARASDDADSFAMSGGKKKRAGREESAEEFAKRIEVRIPIPDQLKVLLVDDWEFITKQNRLVPLPKEGNSVSEVMARYLDFAEERLAGKETQIGIAHEVVNGIIVYFEKALPVNLLYRFERQQYAEERKKREDREQTFLPQHVYGAEHLLRLFVKLPSLVATTGIDPESAKLLQDEIGQILRWMSSEQKNLFAAEYETPAPNYDRGN